MSLTLEEFSDRELLFALEEASDSNGQVSSLALAEALGLQAREGLKHPQQNIAVRLSWLKRYGVVYRDQDSGRWGLTDIGSRIVHGSISAGQRRMLADLDEDRLYAVMQELSRSMVRAHDEAATMTARHWRYTLAERKRARNGRR